MSVVLPAFISMVLTVSIFRPHRFPNLQVFTFKHLERTPGKVLVRSLQDAPPRILGVGNPTLTPTEKLRTVRIAHCSSLLPRGGTSHGECSSSLWTIKVTKKSGR